MFNLKFVRFFISALFLIFCIRNFAPKAVNLNSANLIFVSLVHEKIANKLLINKIKKCIKNLDFNTEPLKIAVACVSNTE